MKLLNRLERKFGRWAIPNLTTILIVGQVMLFILQMGPGGGRILERVYLLPSAVMAGEVWRLVTFVFFPPGRSLIFIFFFWYLFYLYGNTLESLWGTFKYNVYLFIAYFAMIAASFIVWSWGGDFDLITSKEFITSITSGHCDTNTFLFGSVFLAFAHLYPDFTLNLFFVLPIRIKWLALLAWIGYGYVFVRGDMSVRILIIASILNYLLFFGKEHWRDLKQRQRHRSYQSRVQKASKAIQHRCRVCGLDQDQAPRTLFRYCSKCEGQCCYCPEHIHDHEHVTADENDEATVS